ncbi:MAG: VOC family protein [Gaiellaceae bacterium]
MSQRIFPMIAYEDPGAAIDWLTEAFGFRERGERHLMEDGRIGHAELELGGHVVMLATPSREYQSPKVHRETCEAAARWLDNPWVVDGLLVLVDDLDTHHAEAVSAGANVIRPPEEGPDGRLYTAEDLEGHRWMFQQAS